MCPEAADDEHRNGRTGQGVCVSVGDLIRSSRAWYGIPRRTLTTLLGVKAKTKGGLVVVERHGAHDGCIVMLDKGGRGEPCVSGVSATWSMEGVWTGHWIG